MVDLQKGIKIIHYEVLKTFCTRVLVKVGVPAQEAQVIVDSLLDADLRGIGSHGVLRLPTYVKRVRLGLMKAKAEYDYLADTPTITFIDGKLSFGQILGTVAIRIAIEKARKAGIALSVIRNGSHFGAAGYYAMKAAQNRLIGIVLTNTAPVIPAHGGASAVVGNNPISIAVPTSIENRSIVLDAAMSEAAVGKIILAKEKGEPIPLTWATDKDGVPTSDPTEALKGLMLPTGGYKGFGLAFVFEILTGVLSGSDFSIRVKSVYKNFDAPQRVGQFMVVIDPSVFMEYEMFVKKVDEFCELIKTSPKRAGVDTLFFPGEIEFNTWNQRTKEGIPVSLNILRELNELASNIGVKERLE